MPYSILYYNSTEVIVGIPIYNIIKIYFTCFQIHCLRHFGISTSTDYQIQPPPWYNHEFFRCEESLSEQLPLELLTVLPFRNHTQKIMHHEFSYSDLFILYYALSIFLPTVSACMQYGKLQVICIKQQKLHEKPKVHNYYSQEV